MFAADVGKQNKGTNIDVPQIGRQVSWLEIPTITAAKKVIPAIATGTHEGEADRAGKRGKNFRFQLGEFVCVADRRFAAIAKSEKQMAFVEEVQEAEPQANARDDFLDEEEIIQLPPPTQMTPPPIQGDRVQNEVLKG